MLAKIGRGFSDVVVYKEHIKHKTEHLVKSASTPVMTDIEFGFNAKSMEVYPFPVPDLFVGAPIVVASRFEAQSIPDKVVVRGYDPDGELHKIESKVIIRDDLPVDKIFVKQQIDLLTAQAWFKQNKKLEKEVIDISVEHSLPSQYTSLVSYEANANDFEAEQKKWDEEDVKVSDNASAKSKKASVLRNNKKTVGALAVAGTLAIVAVSIASFGDIAATNAGLPAFGNPDELYVSSLILFCFVCVLYFLFVICYLLFVICFFGVFVAVTSAGMNAVKEMDVVMMTHVIVMVIVILHVMDAL